MKLKQVQYDLEELKQEYLQYCTNKGLSQSTINGYNRNIDYYIKFLNGEEISNNSITKYIQYLKKETNRNNISINTLLRSVKIWLDWCYNEDYIDTPIKVQYLKTSQQPKEIYSDDDIKRLLKNPKISSCSYSELRCWCQCTLFLTTGIRRSSLLNIRLEDINWHNNTIKLIHTKNKQIQYVSIPDETAKAIKLWMKYRVNNSEYLFTTIRGTQLNENSITRDIATYNRSRGVSTTSVHAFRHTFATKLVQRGVDVFTVCKLLGHKDIQTTQIYLKGLDVEQFVMKNRFNVLEDIFS